MTTGKIWIWMAAVLVVGATGCAGTPGRMAPIEDGRRVETHEVPPPPGPEKAAPPRSQATSPQVPPGARVYALPDTAVAAPAPVQQADGGMSESPLPARAPADPVTAELLAQAGRALARGDRGAARSTLERAIKLKPRDPAAWIELAELNHAEGEFEQAIVVAQRARNLAGTDQSYLARIDLVLARARARLAR